MSPNKKKKKRTIQVFRTFIGVIVFIAYALPWILPIVASGMLGYLGF